MILATFAKEMTTIMNTRCLFVLLVCLLLAGCTKRDAWRQVSQEATRAFQQDVAQAAPQVIKDHGSNVYSISLGFDYVPNGADRTKVAAAAIAELLKGHPGQPMQLIEEKGDKQYSVGTAGTEGWIVIFGDQVKVSD